MLLCLDFCGEYCSFLVNYSVGLEKAGLRVNRELSQATKEKDIVSNTKVQFLRKKRPSTDFEKNTFLESAHHQLSNSICRFFWAFHDLPTNRAAPKWHSRFSTTYWGGGGKHQKWQNFRVFRDCQTSFQKTSIISETIIARANKKTAFERELNSPSSQCHQMWPKVKGLASRGHQSKKALLSEIFRRETLIHFYMYNDIIGTIVFVSSRQIELHIRWPRKVNFLFWPQVKV